MPDKDEIIRQLQEQVAVSNRTIVQLEKKLDAARVAINMTEDTVKQQDKLSDVKDRVIQQQLEVSDEKCRRLEQEIIELKNKMRAAGILENGD